MTGQEIDQVFRRSNRPHSRSAAAVWDTKCFMEIQMTDISPHVPRPAKSDLRIEVRAIHVNLAAMSVNDLTDFANGFFKHSVRGRISYHERRQFICVRGGFGSQIV